MLNQVLTGEEQTQALARALAPLLTAPLKIYFYGEIGAGKSCFIRALLQQAGISQKIKSPTFSIIETYATADRQYIHIDLYRINDEEEYDYLGIEDYDQPNSIYLIEWPQKVSSLPQADLAIRLESIDFGQKRKISIQSITKEGKKIVQTLNETL